MAKTKEVILKRPKDGHSPRKQRHRIVPPTSKFNYDFVKMAARLKAAGFTDPDLAYALDVSPMTIKNWKKRHPEFAVACSEGTEAAVRYLVAQALRAGAGYDYVETDEKYKTEEYMDEKGNPKTREVFIGKTVKNKHQKSDPFLLSFMLINLSKGQFRNTKYLETTTKSITANIDVRAELTGEEIRKFAGKLGEIAENVERKKVESTEVIDKSRDS